MIYPEADRKNISIVNGMSQMKGSSQKQKRTPGYMGCKVPY